MLMIGLLGYSIFRENGLEARPFNTKVASFLFEQSAGHDEKNQYGRLIKNFMYDCDFYHFSDFSISAAGVHEITGIPKYCYQRGSPGGNAVFLWGDSHAQMLYYGLVQNLPQNIALFQVSRAACKPSITRAADPICDKTNAFALEELAYLKPNVVIIAQRDSWDNQAVKSISEKLTALGVDRILFVGKSPEWRANLPKIILRKYWFNTPQRSIADLNIDSDAADRAAKVFVNTSPRSQFVDLKEYFCNEEGCLIYLGNSLKVGLTSFDGNHLSPIASDAVAKNVLLPLIFGSSNSQYKIH
jgi:hypothetical protein